MAPDDGKEVDQARVPEALADFEAFLARKAFVPVLVSRDSQPDDWLIADTLANSFEDAHAEAHSIFERTAIVVGSTGRRRRPEIVDQMPVAFELEPIEVGGDHSLRRIRVILDDTLDVPIFHLLRKGAMRRLPNVRRRDNWQPLALGKTGAAAE